MMDVLQGQLLMLQKLEPGEGGLPQANALKEGDIA